MTTVIIDVSNICRAEQEFWPLEAERATRNGTPPPPRPGSSPDAREQARLSRYHDVVAAARRTFGKDTTVRAWADRSLRALIDDRPALDELIATGAIKTAGEADDDILAEAQLYGAVVITRDNYRSKRSAGAHDWLNGTTDRVYQPKVRGREGHRHLELVARNMGTVGSSTLRRARNDEQIKARGLTEDDTRYDYACTNRACVHGTTPVLQVLPVRPGPGALCCPACGRPVQRLGERVTPLERISNRSQAPSAATTPGPLGALPSLTALRNLPAPTLAPPADPVPRPLAPAPSVPSAVPAASGTHTSVQVVAHVRGRVVADVRVPAGTSVTLGRNRDGSARTRDGQPIVDVAAPLGADFDLISREHLLVTAHADGTVTVTDTSRNGVFRDGQRLPADTPVPLRGQQVWLGRDLVAVTIA